MNITQRVGILQRWRVVQHELMPELRQEIGPLTPRLEKLIHTLEWVRIEELVESAWNGKGRPPHDRGALANAFVAKALLGLGTTAALIERLQIDRALKRICGFPMWKRLPDESSFSRAFAEFAGAKLLATRAEKEAVLVGKEAATPPEITSGPDPMLEQVRVEHEAALKEREFERDTQLKFMELGLKREQMTVDQQLKTADMEAKREQQRVEAARQAAQAARRPVPNQGV